MPLHAVMSDDEWLALITKANAPTVPTQATPMAHEVAVLLFEAIYHWRIAVEHDPVASERCQKLMTWAMCQPAYKRLMLEDHSPNQITEQQ
jgi:hypothetical protein